MRGKNRIKDEYKPTATFVVGLRGRRGGENRPAAARVPTLLEVTFMVEKYSTPEGAVERKRKTRCRESLCGSHATHGFYSL